MNFPQTRLRRLRYHPTVRNLVKETHFHSDQLVLPLFIRYGNNIKNPILSMPGHYQFSVDQLTKEIETISKLGIKGIILFGIPEKKDAIGSDALSENGIIPTAISLIKKINPDLLVISDVCFCEYTDHGHCGVLSKENDETGSRGQAAGRRPLNVDNDETLKLLAKQALTHARAGADIIAPSGMMDGMVQAIRGYLDEHHYEHLPILSYSAKYASSLYGPFREAAEGAPQFGDRRGYQMAMTNRQEALRECELDIAEGADMLMVKPAHTYLDVITRVKQTYPALPLGAYHTSGEYAMIKAAAEKGWINEQQTTIEILTSIRRAGADFIITYYAKEVAKWMMETDG